MKLSGLSTKAFISLLCITAFFYGIMGNGYVLMALSFLPVFYKMPYMIKKAIPFSWIPFTIFAFVSSIISYVTVKSIVFVFMMIMLLFVRMILENEFGWQKFFFSLIISLAAVNVLATFVSVINPSLMLAYAKRVFSGETLDTYIQLFDTGAYSGLTGQTSINGFFISIFIAFTVNYIFTYPNKFWNYIWLALSIVALFLTQKRSFLIGNIVSTFVLLWRNSSSNTNKVKKVFSLILIAAILYFVVYYTPATKGLVEKIAALDKAKDITNGRAELWKATYYLWRRHSFFGVGINSVVYVYGLSVHNVYLQTLVEIGLVGFLGYLLLIFSSLGTAFKAYDMLLNNNSYNEKDKIICGTSVYIQGLFIVYSFFGNPLYGINFILPYTLFVAVSGSYLNIMRLSIMSETE